MINEQKTRLHGWLNKKVVINPDQIGGIAPGYGVVVHIFPADEEPPDRLVIVYYKIGPSNENWSKYKSVIGLDRLVVKRPTGDYLIVTDDENFDRILKLYETA